MEKTSLKVLLRHQNLTWLAPKIGCSVRTLRRLRNGHIDKPHPLIEQAVRAALEQPKETT